MSQRMQTVALTIAGVVLAVLAVATDLPGWIVAVAFVVLTLGGYLAGRRGGDDE